MAYENKPNTGAMFKNENKTTDKHPDYTGVYYNEKAEKMSAAMWLNESGKGVKYFSFQASEWREKSEKATEAPAAQSTPATDDDLPF